jgi:hypothetical protein
MQLLRQTQPETGSQWCRLLMGDLRSWLQLD